MNMAGNRGKVKTYQGEHNENQLCLKVRGIDLLNCDSLPSEEQVETNITSRN